MKGFSLIIHKDKAGWHFHCGKYVSGIFSDNNQMYNPAEKSGFGLKFDIPVGPFAWPVDYLWKKEAITQVPAIKDIPLEKWDEVFGKDLAQRLRDKIPAGHTVEEVHDFKFGVYNAWKAKYVFRLCTKWFIGPFIAVATPIRSFYIGMKTYDLTSDKPNQYVQADQGDYTWAWDMKNGRYMMPSMSMRRKRK